MRILLIRHGDPDYEHDTLTEKGWREAALLAKRAPYLQMGDCYLSPLGRAQDTASLPMKETGKTGVTKNWLQEFPAYADLTAAPELRQAYPELREEEKKDNRIGCIWDMLPSYWTEHEEYYDRTAWRQSLVAKAGNLTELYDEVTGQLDALLAEYGYVREHQHYRVEREHIETVTFFCHYGISCVLLSHLWNVSPFVLWHSLVLAPSSVTEIYTEEREQGVAYWRATRVGDLSHLYAGGEEPSASARFCEVYSNFDERH